MFARYFGDLPVPLALLIAAAAGAASLGFLRARAGLVLVGRDRIGRGLLEGALLATLLAVPTILVDVVAPFPAGINVASPAALYFYPIIGAVAEVAFHLVPLALLVLVGQLATGTRATERRLWWCFVLVALTEPIFQVAFGWDQSPPWVSVYVAGHLYLFGVLELRSYLRHGFVAMYAFRLVYYLHWHIVWGALRHDLLF
jgi:hypothetical protein